MAHGPGFELLVKKAKSRVTEVSPDEAKQRQSRGAILIDVREADEFANGHAKEAMHLSKGVIEMKIEKEVPDTTTSIICYCGGGNRSVLAVANLQLMGYRNVLSMTGGFKAWKEADLPID